MRKYLIISKLKTLLKIYNKIHSEEILTTKFMVDKRIFNILEYILKNLLNNFTKLDIKYFLLVLLFNKFGKEYLTGLIGLELFECIYHIMTSINNLLKYPNYYNFYKNQFATRFDYFRKIYPVWQELDTTYYIEELNNYIEALKELKTQDKLTQEDKNFIDDEIIKRNLDINKFSSVKLIETFKDLINLIKSLTPNNKRKQEEITNMFDFELLEQMIKFNAFELSDFKEYSNKVIQIIREYSCPASLDDFNIKISELDNITNIDELIPNFFSIIYQEVITIKKQIYEFYKKIENT